MYDTDPSAFRDAQAFLDRSFTPASRNATEVSSGCAISPNVIGDSSEPGGSLPLERETGGQFTMGQNYPNPYTDETTVPFVLANAADVQLTIYDPLSRKVASVVRKGMSAGEHRITLNFRGLDLPSGDYIYQLQVSNRHGVYRLRRTMTAK